MFIRQYELISTQKNICGIDQGNVVKIKRVL